MRRTADIFSLTLAQVRMMAVTIAITVAALAAGSALGSARTGGGMNAFAYVAMGGIIATLVLAAVFCGVQERRDANRRAEIVRRCRR